MEQFEAVIENFRENFAEIMRKVMKFNLKI